MTDIHQYISVIRETCLADALASSLLVVFSISVDYLGSESGRSLSLGVGYRIWYVLDTNFFSKTGLRLGALTQVQSSRTPKINGSVKREFSLLSCSQLSQVFCESKSTPADPLLVVVCQSWFSGWHLAALFLKREQYLKTKGKHSVF